MQVPLTKLLLVRLTPHAPIACLFFTDGLVFRQRICYVVRRRPLSGVTVIAWWRLIGICMCLEE